jgi:DNA repair exonuclease SbcCD nuclease subunit
MRGIALADLHLGFSGTAREINGRNARERDVEAAWRRAVDNIIARQPDLVTVAGDIFHHPRVSMHAVTAFRDGIRRISQETSAHVVIIQGNHDAPRSAATRTPIVIPDDYERVYVILEPTRIPLVIERTGERVAVACFPFVALGADVAFKVEPDPTADINILLVHAAVKGSDTGDALPYFYGGAGALDIGREANLWDVIAVGDFHEFTRLHPTRLAFYSGSIERTSSNIWPEAKPKGVVAYDTETGDLELVEHETRTVRDLMLGDYDEGSVLDINADVVNRALARIHEEPATQDAIVRLRVPEFPRAERDQIDWQLVRELKQQCLHFHLDVRYTKSGAVEVADRRAEGASRTMADAARDFFASDRPGVRDVVLRYLGLDQDEPAADPEPEPELIEAEVAHA